jgi:crotonobetainyl-CoA:carnitine CoA-transferase CaiB-like acyl-CoA transferase
VDALARQDGGVRDREHDEIGRMIVPTTPFRIHGAESVDTVPSPKLGQHNREIYGTDSDCRPPRSSRWNEAPASST